MMKSTHEFNGVSLRIEKAGDQTLMPSASTIQYSKTEAPSAHKTARRPSKMTPNEPEGHLLLTGNFSKLHIRMQTRTGFHQHRIPAKVIDQTRAMSYSVS